MLTVLVQARLVSAMCGARAVLPVFTFRERERERENELQCIGVQSFLCVPV